MWRRRKPLPQERNQMNANSNNLFSHIYGMKFRGFSPMAQPNGAIDHMDIDKAKYGFYSLVGYDRQLSDDEVEDYELTYLGIYMPPKFGFTKACAQLMKYILEVL